MRLFPIPSRLRPTSVISIIDVGGAVVRLLPRSEAGGPADGEAWAIEKVELITHNGTHLDAPYHFASTMNEGERALTIDEVPLDWCFRPGVKLDFRQLPDGHVVTAAEVEAELDRIGYRLQPLDIWVINTRAGAAYGQSDYVNAGCGIGAEGHALPAGARGAADRHRRLSWDAPFVYTAARYATAGDPRIIWEGHKAGRKIGYCHLEKLHNLEALPPYGFTLACFPVKIRGASAGWTRAVAIMDSESA